MSAALAKIDPRIINNVRAATNAAAGLAPMDISKQRANFQKMQKAATQGMPQNKPAAKPADSLTEEQKKKQQLDQMMKPVPPKGGMSR
jgi:hypothetical protein